MVATPIGNLGDITLRAVEVLRLVDVVAAEDTRHSARLFNHLGISKPMISLHEHNEARAVSGLIARLECGERVALISDAGTPLLSDPGYQLVHAAGLAGLRVSPVPGPSAITAALSAAGLPTDRFIFEGFLPAKGAARRQRLRELVGETRTLVFFESPHRVAESLTDMGEVLGQERPGTVARELTKMFEEIHSDTLGNLILWLQGRPERRKGEFVLLVGGVREPDTGFSVEDDRILGLLLDELPVKTAAALAADIRGGRKNAFYRRALEVVDADES
ncbi:MAG: 16S rRNA (cytidine(1402)-2'-O)-methyltransferase [Gammaproteobacteria bacterium]|nr:16S rRNA (cytidine(1402)-2'-O)-methyltransferase [Gammaproteobacteria bacterium]